MNSSSISSVRLFIAYIQRRIKLQRAYNEVSLLAVPQNGVLVSIPVHQSTAQVSRTLLELYFVREYLYQRAFTSFYCDIEEIDVEESFAVALSQLSPFYVDHKLGASILTLDDIEGRAGQYASTESYAKGLQHLLAGFAQELNKREPMACLNGAISTSLQLDLAQDLLKDIEDVQEGKDSDISRAYDEWPLDAVSFQENEIDELRECYLVDLLPRLQRIRRLVKQDRSKEWLWINELHELISRCGAGTMQRRIIEQLCPSFLSEGASKDIKGVRAALKFVDKVDSAVYALRKVGAIPSDIILNVISMEISFQPNVRAFLFRATKNANQDSTIAKNQHDSLKLNVDNAHSLSFGRSLFTGLFHDRSANPLALYRRSSFDELYMIPISTSDADIDNIFTLPSLPAFVELFGLGELFHPRSKVWIASSNKDSTSQFTGGILNCTYKRTPVFLTAKDHNTAILWENYKARRIVLQRKGKKQ